MSCHNSCLVTIDTSSEDDYELKDEEEEEEWKEELGYKGRTD